MTHWLLEFDGVHYSYPASQQPALNGLTLRVPAGKKSALIGHNGCGKSTLLFLADGLHQPQQGMLRWHGKPMRYDRHSLIQLRQKVGLVFQDPEQQLVAPTVEEDISYGLCNLGLSAAEISWRVDGALADFGLTELATRPVHHLSLGQKKRVALAGVMVLQPELLLLDEPTAYLDPLQTRQLMAKLEQIHAAGTTQLMATHDLNLAYQWADWIFVIHQGRLITEGDAVAVFSQRHLLQDLQLGVPLLWEVWETILEQMPLAAGMQHPKTVDELREQLLLKMPLRE
ncbi:energy-coupling factor ABC transporter ATP-binding protein [Microcoleus sp. FACHB-672]|uniref:energy-coupling factor ABC transporter ATP-binding protein n=1 Tax=Microcoleus sp. FACHB-672 TaxID=2692825 RepID=UPI0016899335|nr:ABC transporter ATP-binding protein [Microcoleus sp. FACHB-672]MBD2039330.1 ABC transporter ATP-binding protein [Microcoleus sp. FACHB-672]